MNQSPCIGGSSCNIMEGGSLRIRFIVIFSKNEVVLYFLPMCFVLLNYNLDRSLNMARSHGLVVKADGSRSRGRGFEPRRRKTGWMLIVFTQHNPPATLKWLNHSRRVRELKKQKTQNSWGTCSTGRRPNSFVSNTRSFRDPFSGGRSTSGRREVVRWWPELKII